MNFKKAIKKNEILHFLVNNTNKNSASSSINGIFCTIKDNYIMLQKRNTNLFRNPFQRIFICKIKEEKNGCTISGYFLYRLAVFVPFILLILLCFYKNIQAIITLESLPDKIVVTLLFSIFYLTIGVLFITGKYLYKEQESTIVKFLNNI